MKAILKSYAMRWVLVGLVATQALPAMAFDFAAFQAQLAQQLGQANVGRSSGSSFGSSQSYSNFQSYSGSAPASLSQGNTQRTSYSNSVSSAGDPAAAQRVLSGMSGFSGFSGGMSMPSSVGSVGQVQLPSQSGLNSSSLAAQIQAQVQAAMSRR